MKQQFFSLYKVGLKLRIKRVQALRRDHAPLICMAGKLIQIDAHAPDLFTQPAQFMDASVKPRESILVHIGLHKGA